MTEVIVNGGFEITKKNWMIWDGDWITSSPPTTHSGNHCIIQDQWQSIQLFAFIPNTILVSDIDSFSFWIRSDAVSVGYHVLYIYTVEEGQFLYLIDSTTTPQGKWKKIDILNDLIPYPDYYGNKMPSTDHIGTEDGDVYYFLEFYIPETDDTAVDDFSLIVNGVEQMVNGDFETPLNWSFEEGQYSATNPHTGRYCATTGPFGDWMDIWQIVGDIVPFTVSSITSSGIWVRGSLTNEFWVYIGTFSPDGVTYNRYEWQPDFTVPAGKTQGVDYVYIDLKALFGTPSDSHYGNKTPALNETIFFLEFGGGNSGLYDFALDDCSLITSTPIPLKIGGGGANVLEENEKYWATESAQQAFLERRSQLEKRQREVGELKLTSPNEKIPQPETKSKRQFENGPNAYEEALKRIAKERRKRTESEQK